MTVVSELNVMMMMMMMMMIGSQLRALQRAKGEVRSPYVTLKGWLKKRICRLETYSLIFL